MVIVPIPLSELHKRIVKFFNELSSIIYFPQLTRAFLSHELKTGSIVRLYYGTFHRSDFIVRHIRAQFIEFSPSGYPKVPRKKMTAEGNYRNASRIRNSFHDVEGVVVDHSLKHRIEFLCVKQLLYSIPNSTRQQLRFRPWQKSQKAASSYNFIAKAVTELIWPIISTIVNVVPYPIRCHISKVREGDDPSPRAHFLRKRPVKPFADLPLEH